jgi:hypothetical protein
MVPKNGAEFGVDAGALARPQSIAVHPMGVKR